MKVPKRFIKRPTTVSGGGFENGIEKYGYNNNEQKEKVHLDFDQPLLDLEDEETCNRILAEFEEKKREKERKQREDIERNNKLIKKMGEKYRQIKEDRPNTQSFFSYIDQKKSDTH
ncbi:hypothetical protein DS745_21470 [Anaerobacillus alkaliphilus]|uniref:Uncharacterized protein n=1 Tax=Anaerobacillus alkaliphilus TaxID=1548597 RepID=A0A4Q0VNB2_9BACI|nr:hypothetical protein [Anaerobacillus alkaliphilus]RXI96302.1 hypothetical protein DS745_21470 [Anaerobacillus alkaliphilus]